MIVEVVPLLLRPPFGALSRMVSSKVSAALSTLPLVSVRVRVRV